MKMPTSWKEISLKTFVILQEIANDPDTDKTDKDIDAICLLAGITYQECMELTLKEKQQALKSLSFLQDLNKINPKAHRYIKIGRIWFKIALDVSEISGGQYLDLMTFLKDPDKAFENIHNVLAVLATPLKFGIIKTKYDGAKHADRGKLFYENLSISQAYPIMVFFCTLSDHLTINILDSLKKQTLKMKQSLMNQKMTS